jgi:hypothetical protein
MRNQSPEVPSRIPDRDTLHAITARPNPSDAAPATLRGQPETYEREFTRRDAFSERRRNRAPRRVVVKKKGGLNKWLLIGGGLLGFYLLLRNTPAPPGPGTLRDDLIKRGEEMLKRTGVGLPNVSTNNIARVGVTGGPVPQAVIKQATEALQSPSNVDEVLRKAQELQQKMKKMQNP